MPRLVHTASALETVVAELSSAEEIVLDTEFHLERHYFPQLMLIQLRADDGDPILIDPLVDLDLGALGAVLERRPVVVHGGASDVQILSRRLGVSLSVAFDTQIAAGCVGLGYPLRLQDLASRCLGRRMPKGETLSDWSVRPLSDRQLSYAVDDVMVLGPLRREIAARLDGPQGTLAAAFTAEMVGLALAGDDDDAAWMSVGGAHLLDGPDRARLQGLARWRQREARARDVPRHSIVSDGILLDIARRAPLSLDALRANRRMPTSVWKREGEAIVACLSAAETAVAPGPPCQRPRAWIDLVRAAGRVVEARTGVAAELVLPDRVIAVLAAGAPLPDWRRDALGVEFFAFLDGKGTLTMPADLRGFTIS